MKVLHINTSDLGGAAIGAIRLHKSLLENGIESKILFQRQITVTIPNSESIKIKYPNFKQRILKKIGLNLTQFEIANKEINSLGKPFSEGGSFELFSSPYSNEVDLHNHPLVRDADIINLHWIAGFVDLPSFVKAINKPVVWTFHDMNPLLGGFHYDIDLYNNQHFRDLENRYKKIKKEIFKNKNHTIICNSNWLASEVKKSKQFDKAISINAVYYPLKPEDFSIINKSVAKTSFNLPLNKLILGFACEDLKNPRKGFKLLIDALSLLNKKDRAKICCLTFGQENHTITNIDGLEVIQLGPINNSKIQSIAYSAMDFFIIPSIAEAFGLTSLEAMLCQTPVLGSNIGGIPEMVINDKTGYLFESNNLLALKNIIQKSINITPEKITQLGKSANEHVLTYHLPSTISDQYLKIYSKAFEWA